jgi:hypothetical protein
MKGADQEAQKRCQEWFTLVEDGLKKAEQTRAKERVQRIGQILANSLVRVPVPNADDVEEMMRIAMELSDSEVQSLDELVKVQGPTVERLGKDFTLRRVEFLAARPLGSPARRRDR